MTRGRHPFTVTHHSGATRWVERQRHTSTITLSSLPGAHINLFCFLCSSSPSLRDRFRVGWLWSGGDTNYFLLKLQPHRAAHRAHVGWLAVAHLPPALPPRSPAVNRARPYRWVSACGPSCWCCCYCWRLSVARSSQRRSRENMSRRRSSSSSRTCSPRHCYFTATSLPTVRSVLPAHPTLPAGLCLAREVSMAP